MGNNFVPLSIFISALGKIGAAFPDGGKNRDGGPDMMPPLPFDFSIRADAIPIAGATFTFDSLLAATSLSIDGLVAMSC